MSRGFPSNTAAALGSSLVRPITFAKIEFDAETLYLHNGLGSYVWGSETWTGLGDFASISSVEEAIQVKPYALTLTVSGIDTSINDFPETALTLNYYLRPVTIYLGCVDVDDALIDDPTQIWAGHVDAMDVTVGAQGETGDLISMTCESELSKFDRSSSRRFTNEQLQADYSGDKLFSAMHLIEGAKVRWRNGNASGVAGVPDTHGGNPDPDKHQR